MNVLLQPEPTPLLIRHVALNKDSEEHKRLVNDDFMDDCVYQPSDFKRRFCLQKNVFQRIVNNVYLHHSSMIRGAPSIFFTITFSMNELNILKLTMILFIKSMVHKTVYFL